MKCPLCHYENEEGVLFCEQCKSDLGVLETTGIPESAVAEMVAAVPMIPIPAERASDDVVVGSFAPPEAAIAVGEVSATPPPDAAVPVPDTLAIAAPAVEAESLRAPATAPDMEATPASAAPFSPESSAPITAALLPPRLVVTRGQKINEEFPLFDGENYIGRADDKPVDIDLEHQEHPERVWSSRQHAVVTLEDGTLTIEDLNSSNGTFVNRSRIMPGEKRPLKPGDVIQVGTVQLKVKS